MRRSPYMFATLATALLALLLCAGCRPKPPKPIIPTGDTGTQTQPSEPTPPTQPPQPPPPSPAPTITLQVDPSAIDSGRNTTLTWSSLNATGVTIDHNVGTVEPTGSRTVSPEISTTYKATATGPGGRTVAEARVTVKPKQIIAIPSGPTTIIDKPFIIEDEGSVFNRDIRDAFFDYDQYSIRDNAREALQSDVRFLTEHPKIMITIEGYCDERGSDKYNLALGDRRANAVKDYLVSQGIGGNRIDTVSFGKERSFCEEHNEECWQSNRRAHFVMR
jgi:peptidoglycan-associated lipoprotein